MLRFVAKVTDITSHHRIVFLLNVTGVVFLVRPRTRELDLKPVAKFFHGLVDEFGTVV